MTVNDYLFLKDDDDGPMVFSRKFALLDPHDDKGTYILQEEFWVRWWVDASSVYRIRIPVGFKTDVASIPSFAWGIAHLTPDGLYRNAALIHDAGYMWQGKFPLNWFQKQNINGTWVDMSEHKWTKDQVDKLFLRIMKACGVSAFKRSLIYYSVFAFGGFAWRKTDETREEYRHAFDG